MDDEEWRGDLSEVLVIGKAVAGKKGDAGDRTEGAHKGGNENEGSVIVSRSKPARRTGPDRLSHEDEIGRGHAKRSGEVLVGGFDGTVAPFFIW